MRVDAESDGELSGEGGDERRYGICAGRCVWSVYGQCRSFPLATSADDEQTTECDRCPMITQ